MYDVDFLYSLDKLKVKTQYIKIVLLDFQENELREIQGNILSGSVSVNGSSAIRRTINLSMFADKDNNNLTNLDNLISLNKKIKVYVGYKNPFPKYEDIIWFKCGLYIISTASISASSTGVTISIQGKDKMVMLDGSVGGTLPASVTFDEIYKVNPEEEGSYTITEPTIFQIIQEAVNHFGKEKIENIIISDIEEAAKLLISYRNSASPIYFTENYSAFQIGDSPPSGWTNYHKYVDGQDIGYMETPFTYPGDLELAAGNTVCNLLDAIVQTLGNYEYFYDLDGRFIFQEIKNYKNKKYVQDLSEIKNDSYLRTFTDSKYAYIFANSEEIMSFNSSPRYDNIKNDFIVWGSKTLPNGVTSQIRYHLVIDDKPKDFYYSKQYMRRLIGSDGEIYNVTASFEDDDPYTDFPLLVDTLDENLKLRKEGVITVYNVGTIYKQEESNEYYLCKDETEEYYQFLKLTLEIIGSPISTFEWREELYRKAVYNQFAGIEEHYDQELLTEWRKLFDPNNLDWKSRWEEEQLGVWNGWNPDVRLSPQSLNYWLDFIDTTSIYGAYSVKNIGYRTKVVVDNNIKTLINKEIPDIIFIENTGVEAQNEAREKKSSGQDVCLVQPNKMIFFGTSSSTMSCFEMVRELVYQHFIYNTQVNITCIPRYYLEPNQLVYLYNKETCTEGEYIISSFTLPLDYSGTMSISLTETSSKV